MDLRDAIEHMEEPDPRAVDRIWRRFEDSRARRRWPAWTLAGAGGLGLAGAAVAAAVVALSWPSAERTLQLESLATRTHTWSEQVSLDVTGRGTVRGTDQDVQIRWLSGHLRIEVEPNTGTRLQVHTDEARVQVIGTVLSVDRGALGVAVGVEKGRVRVTCRDGWSGDVTAESGPHTCQPVA